MPSAPRHKPAAPDAPIPGRHWYSGCDPDGPTVGADGICEGCGETACPVCGHGIYPDGICGCPPPPPVFKVGTVFRHGRLLNPAAASATRERAVCRVTATRGDIVYYGLGADARTGLATSTAARLLAGGAKVLP